MTGFTVSPDALRAADVAWDEQAGQLSQATSLLDGATTTGIAEDAVGAVSSFLSTWSTVASNVASNARTVSGNLGAAADAYERTDESVVHNLGGFPE